MENLRFRMRCLEDAVLSARVTQMCLRFLGCDGGVVVRFSLRHVGISMVFWERSTLIQVFTGNVRKKGCLCQNLKTYKTYNGEALWEGEGHGKEEDMESAYIVNEWNV